MLFWPWGMTSNRIALPFHFPTKEIDVRFRATYHERVRKHEGKTEASYQLWTSDTTSVPIALKIKEGYLLSQFVAFVVTESFAGR